MKCVIFLKLKNKVKNLVTARYNTLKVIHGPTVAIVMFSDQFAFMRSMIFSQHLLLCLKNSASAGRFIAHTASFVRTSKNAKGFN